MSSTASALITVFWISVGMATETTGLALVVLWKPKNPFHRRVECRHMTNNSETDQTHKTWHQTVCEYFWASVLHRSGGFLSKILKKRPHKEAQTPDNGELTLAQILNERPAGGEGKEYTRTIGLALTRASEEFHCSWEEWVLQSLAQR